MNWSACINNGVATLDCVPLLITNIIYWLLVLSGSVSLIFIIVAGIRYITSGGDAKQLDQARKTAVYAIAGLILVVCSFLIVETIANVTGVACIKNFSITSKTGASCQ